MNIIFGQNASLTRIFDNDKDVLLFKVVCSFKIAGF